MIRSISDHLYWSQSEIAYISGGTRDWGECCSKYVLVLSFQQAFKIGKARLARLRFFKEAPLLTPSLLCPNHQEIYRLSRLQTAIVNLLGLTKTGAE